MSMSIPKRVRPCDFLGHVVHLLFSPRLASVSVSRDPKDGGREQLVTLGWEEWLGRGCCGDGPRQRGFETW